MSRRTIDALRLYKQLRFGIGAGGTYANRFVDSYHQADGIAPQLEPDELLHLLADLPTSYAAQRRWLIDAIALHLSRRRVFDSAVLARTLAAMARVPREHFVPADALALAYLPMAGDIGYGQSISHPHLVAAMTSAIQPDRHSSVLDVGTGSGYQAAVLAQLAGTVLSVEIIPALGRQAATKLRQLGHDNVRVLIADGVVVAGGAGPFDSIVVAAAADTVPLPLIACLKEGGRLVMPVGATNVTQRLSMVRRRSIGFESIDLGPVQFVPLTGRHGRLTGIGDD